MDKRDKQETKEKEKRSMAFKDLVAKTSLEFAAKLFLEKGKIEDIAELDFYQWLNICKTIPVVSISCELVLGKMSIMAKKFSQWHDIRLCAPQDSAYGELSLQKMEELAKTVDHWLIIYKCAVPGSEQSVRAISGIRKLGCFETWVKILNTPLSTEELKGIAIEELNAHYKVSDQWLGICKSADPDSVLGKLALEKAMSSLRNDNTEQCFGIYKNMAMPAELRQAAFERISSQI